MMGGLVIAGLISFAAGFVLRVAAFAIFSLATCGLYLAVLLHNGDAFWRSLVAAAVLLFVMQIGYVLGILAPALARAAPRLQFPDHSKPPRLLNPPENKPNKETYRF
jgi:hypothetical protein